MGPRTGLDGFGKSRLSTAFDALTIHPAASRYTDYAIPAHHW